MLYPPLLMIASKQKTLSLFRCPLVADSLADSFADTGQDLAKPPRHASWT
jgi:hypothetical protein